MSKRTFPVALEPQYRDAVIRKLDRAEGEPDDTPALYEVAVSSETPVERWFGREILSHAKAAVDMKRMKNGAAVLVDHWSDQVGVVESARIDDDKVMRAMLRFSRNPRAQEIERDVNDGIRRHISVGYIVHRAKLLEEGSNGSPDVWEVTRWEPLEVSIVSVPADATVGVGRNMAGTRYPVVVEDGEAVEEGVSMVPEDRVVDAPPARNGADVALDSKQAADIIRMCEANGCAKYAAAFIERGLKVGEVAVEILKLRTTTGEPVVSVDEQPKGMDLSQYSYVRAIAGALAIREGKSQEFKGLELEVHQEMARNLPPMYAVRGGVFTPLRTRSLDTKTLSKGAEFVSDQPGDVIELLRNRSVVLGRGARVLTGLGAPIAFPRQRGGMTFYWLGENPAAAVTASDPTFGLSLLAPKNLMGAGKFSRQLLILGNRDVEAMLRDEIAIGHALALDKAAIHGKGVAGEPAGLYAAADVNVVAMGGVPTFGKFIDMQTEVAKDNAALGNMGTITTPAMAGKMRQTLVASAAGSEMIWMGNMNDGSLAGYPAAASNQVSGTMTGSAETGGAEQGIVFGNWNDLLFGMFSGLELIVDPYTDAGYAMVRITSFEMSDVLPRHGESFCKATGATLS